MPTVSVSKSLTRSVPQRWPICWWIAVAIDHYSRRVVGFDSYRQQPTSNAVRAFVQRSIRVAGAAPVHLITDQGTQFQCHGFRRWCHRRRIVQRFGALGKHGSIAVIERFIRTMKEECTRRILVPYDDATLRREISLYVSWYNAHRPHSILAARTPNEVYYGRSPACDAPRSEPRRRWPRSSPCAAPQAPIRGRRAARLNLRVSYVSGRTHLPFVHLDRAA